MPTVVDSARLEQLSRLLESEADVLDSYLFGSRARGDSRRDSDFDLAVYLDPTTPADRFATRRIELIARIAPVVGTDAVDVVLLNEATPLLYHRVLRDGMRLGSRDLVATTRRAGQALSRYCDYLPQLAKIESAHRRRIAAGAFGR